ncbi:MAG: DUF5331 domain-containing protein [Cyanobacteria bacterium CRU_2_1]|nr:DUF5331 domain-containing protein [Cyanobacteria bacterium RU_5_0]NJR61858.1 DUF5331 domain-containing protein [Cyanobacteria bacterium CRU_2_1]
MNIEHLRQSLKAQWLSYYRKNRSWLTRLGVWVNCEGQRRPSSSFILATLSTLEPQLTELFPLVVDLSSNPDRIVIALGLNFNPDDELEAFDKADQPPEAQVKMLLSGAKAIDLPTKPLPAQKAAPTPDAIEIPAEPATNHQTPPITKTIEAPARDASSRHTTKTDESCQGVRSDDPKTR